MRITAKRVCEFLRRMKELQNCSFDTIRLSEKEKLVILTVRISDREYQGAGINARLALEDLMQKVLEVEE
jgi:hypothetical protein